MRREELVEELITKLKKYKNIEKLETYLKYTEDFFNSENDKYNCEIFPLKYINEQKKNINTLKATQRNDDCDYCEKALAEKEKLMKTLDSTFDVVSDMDYFIDSCKKTCPKYAKETFFYYLNDEGLECIESMIEVFGIEKAMDFCILNAYKFFWRCDKKDKLWDVDKGLSYLTLYMKLKLRQERENDVQDKI